MPEGRAPVVWVVAVALIAADLRILMQRRRRDRAHGGLWEFPGGKIEAGETPDAAAAREIREELGMDLNPSELQTVSFASSSAVPESSGQPHVILLYACRQWHGEARCLDAEELAWFAPRELEYLAMPPLDYPLAQALVTLLQ